ncbi:MAG TPA: DUF1254 domain-containing protein, partial [Polyangiaceae bacterium]|nr:DUF1254 domain-containing protein [Polyangiaceae bacterium]
VPEASAPGSVRAAADAAFEYGFPLVEVMRVCSQFPVVNRLFPKTQLITPAERTVVLPNNDTLYTTACIYLGAGWVQLTLPPTSGRYQSAEVFDAYTNAVLVASARDGSDAARSFVLQLAGSSADGAPAGVPVVEVQTPFAFVLIRTLVSGADDLAAANAAQRLLRLTASVSAAPPAPKAPGGTTEAQRFFLSMMQRLGQNPPPVSERERVASFAAAGIRPCLEPDLSEVGAEQLAAWEAAHAQGLARLDAAEGTLASPRGAWIFLSPDVAAPGTNYALRAAVARHALFPLPPSESIYPRIGSDGSQPRVLRLPSRWPPLDAGGFWSLTLYSGGYLFDNPIGRYSLGDRTPGLRRQADGSIEIHVRDSDPGGDQSSNWLPAPPGAYSLTLRLYLPNPAAQASSFELPALE